MGLFDFLKSEPYHHPQLGTLSRSQGYWRGTLMVPSHGAVELILTGNRSQPDSSALELATQFVDRYPSLVSAIESALFEHHEPYLQAVRAGEYPDAPDQFPNITDAQSVWSYVKMEYILIDRVSGVLTVEIAFTTQWDIEHTLGVDFSNWKFDRLCGSVRSVGHS